MTAVAKESTAEGRRRHPLFPLADLSNADRNSDRIDHLRGRPKGRTIAAADADLVRRADA